MTTESTVVIKDNLEEEAKRLSLRLLSEAGDVPKNAFIYRGVMQIAEKAVLKATLAYCKNNQSQSAELLGINRATLRTKAARFNLLIINKKG